MGSFVAASLQGWFKGTLGEIVVYDSALSDEDVARVRGYLGTKYGIEVG